MRNVSHKFVVCTAIGQTFRLMTRWFLLAIEASNLYRSVVGYSIIHNHSEKFFFRKVYAGLEDVSHLCWTIIEMAVIEITPPSPCFSLYNHALQTFKLTTGGGQCKIKLKYFLWSTWECPVISFCGENRSIFLVPRHILKIKECHVISFVCLPKIVC